ncbi:MAG: hypothetical protein FWE77_03860 [Clostridia bacterium]|nr:hypothetical protein [Clostridia bacterium]
MNEIEKIYQSVLQSTLGEHYTLLGARHVNENDVYFSLDILYKQTRHQIQLVRDHPTPKWVLTPYKDSFFATKATAFGFDIILRAMYEHTELHRAQKNDP